MGLSVVDGEKEVKYGVKKERGVECIGPGKREVESGR